MINLTMCLKYCWSGTQGLERVHCCSGSRRTGELARLSTRSWHIHLAMLRNAACRFEELSPTIGVDFRMKFLDVNSSRTRIAH
jgi:hypothetical protein